MTISISILRARVLTLQTKIINKDLHLFSKLICVYQNHILTFHCYRFKISQNSILIFPAFAKSHLGISDIPTSIFPAYTKSHLGISDIPTSIFPAYIKSHLGISDIPTSIFPAFAKSHLGISEQYFRFFFVLQKAILTFSDFLCLIFCFQLIIFWKIHDIKFNSILSKSKLTKSARQLLV